MTAADPHLAMAGNASAPSSGTRPESAQGGLSRRQWLSQGAGWLLLLTGADLARGAGIVSVRIWPAADYCRVTIESDLPLKARHLLVPDPPRLALDIEGLELSPALRDLVAKVRADDPTIAGIRVGQFAPNIVRLVIDLKQEVVPQVFNLEPVAAYKNRLVFDLYPMRTVDPLRALISERLSAATGAPAGAGTTTAPFGPGAGAAPGLAAGRGTTSASSASALSTSPANDALKLRQSATMIDPLGDLMSAKVTPKPGSAPRLPPPVLTTVSKAPPASAPPLPDEGELTRTDRLVVIALDPGHGGEDPGAIGPSGTREKDVVLQIALRLRERINATRLASKDGELAMHAYLTRDADFFVPLQTRVQKARRVQADLFVSIHADAFLTPAAKGASVFALSQGAASSSAARWMADKENKSDLIGGVNVKVKDVQVQHALLDMSTTAQINDSLRLGTALLGTMGKVGNLHKARVEQAGFAVLKAPDIPSVLVETAFISNPEEEARLRSDDYQEQLADALMAGISRYFARNPPLARNRSM